MAQLIHIVPMHTIDLTPSQLRKAADLKERIEGLQEQLNELLGTAVEVVATEAPEAPKTGRRKRRKLSPQAIANIRAGAAKRMGRTVATVTAEPARKGKRQMSAAGRAAISAAAKARWAKIRGEKVTTEPLKKGKSKFSAAAKARLSALAKARWAKVKAQGKTGL